MKKALIFAGGGSRGAFQIGVWKYLVQRGWIPDMICGTSVGALNAAGIASGLGVETLERIWTTYNRRKMYRLNLVPFLSYALSGKALKPLLDTRPMQRMISDHVDFARMKSSRIKVVISTVNILSGRACYFSNTEIGLAHLLASSAMPVLFPWQFIDGEPHWDGGIMANIPLQPALALGAQEIIVVLLSPVGHTPQIFPGDVRTALEHVLEQFLAAPYQSALTARGYIDNPLPADLPAQAAGLHQTTARTGQPRIITLAPEKMLGFRSLLRFSLTEARQLIDEGYKAACMNLKPFV